MAADRRLIGARGRRIARADAAAVVVELVDRGTGGAEHGRRRLAQVQVRRWFDSSADPDLDTQNKSLWIDLDAVRQVRRKLLNDPAPFCGR